MRSSLVPSKAVLGIVAVACGAMSAMPTWVKAAEFRHLGIREYRERIKSGWIGQMVGVAWGAPTEGKFVDRIIPADAMPKWEPKKINDAFGQDDLYVEMTFLRSMELYGLDVSIRQAGIDFANTKFPLWCANAAGRNNLRNGIAPPDSSHPRFHRAPNDIDYQIEADYSGLIAPGLPNVVIQLGEKFGRLMNYGDGVYAGQFIGGMYAEAFFESDPVKIVEAALKCIPAQSHYAEMVRDLLQWYRDDPNDWEKAWGLCQKKWRKDPAYQKDSTGVIDVRINGAYVLVGLLYGKRDLDQTIIISCRCGLDSDCNPSSSAGVLFTTIPFSKLPERFTKELDEKAVFSHTPYNFPALLDVCEKLARQFVVRAGGRIEKNAAGEEEFVIPVLAPQTSPLQRSWEPGPIANSRFTEEEMAKITEPGPIKAFETFAPGWKMRDCGTDMDPGPRDKWRGRKNVYVTHPKDKDTPCVLSRKVDVPAGRTTTLRVIAGHHPDGDWMLVVRANGKVLAEKPVGKDTATKNWLTLNVDLSEYAGKTIELELLNQATDWSHEAAYWGEIAIESK